MKLGFRVLIIILCGLCWASMESMAGTMERPCHQHLVYFEGTPNELNVYRIKGVKPGKTLMLIGGIQGDEPGGFLSADLYADMSLAKGNLIVVPRANYYSVIMNHRGPDGDMNRQFGDPVTALRHKKIVRILKDLISESDCLLNLHDGSGFFRPKWEGPMANPKRYGQSLIADTDVFVNEKGEKIDLKGMANRILPKVNTKIKQRKYHILFNNHRTSSPKSLHKEQRRSATYYALRHCGIPAFGVESSKSLPTVEMKIRHHNLVINAFMDELGIEREHPAFVLPKPKMHFVLVSINNANPVMVAKSQTLWVRKGDKLKVLHIEANYERGLNCDFKGTGSINDLRRQVTIESPTTLVVRKDSTKLGYVRIDFSKAQGDFLAVRSPILYFLVEIDGQRRVLANGETLRLTKGDKLTLVDLLSNLANQSGVTVNFKGFVPKIGGRTNQGEDRGYEIDTGEDLLARYSRCPKNSSQDSFCYRIVAKKADKTIGQIQVRLKPAKLDYLVLKRKNGHKMVYHNGESIPAEHDEIMEIVDLKTNLKTKKELKLALNSKGKSVNLNDWRIDTSNGLIKEMARKNKGGLRLVVLRAEQAIGHVRLNIGEK